jgi:AcrR family transcriptional regulator
MHTAGGPARQSVQYFHDTMVQVLRGSHTVPGARRPSGRNQKSPPAPAPVRTRRGDAKVPAAEGQPSPREARILRAAIEELARSDYGGLAFDRVAARAGVNKTTVYRHWETKAELVRAALSLVVQSVIPEVSAGTLREDLIRIGRRMVDFSTSFEGQCLLRLRLLQHPEPELASIAKNLHAQHIAQLAALADAATQRGEVGGGVDFKLILDMLGGALHSRLFMKNEPVDDVLIARMVDILLRGVSAGNDRSPGDPRTARPRRKRGRLR